jgi:hypothetical protein
MKTSELRKVTRRHPDQSSEGKRLRYLIKTNTRCTRAKQARRGDELTAFVTAEGHRLRILRNSCTKIEWHVDHIIPLKGKTVSGLHVWNNLQVIPKTLNLRKGAQENYHPLYYQWPAGLQAGTGSGEEGTSGAGEGTSGEEPCQSDVGAEGGGPS